MTSVRGRWWTESSSREPHAPVRAEVVFLCDVIKLLAPLQKEREVCVGGMCVMENRAVAAEVKPRKSLGDERKTCLVNLSVNHNSANIAAAFSTTGRSRDFDTSLLGA
ncbi:hypothetical protein Z043_115929 [Scleropages formosus]|uniref:Uncharacterized protein n=1 Tax=Scleropages formosus TaxID=113540 RepID=A0A0N8JY61_SCLFO|nr:hypothetical protein Z043_115929 [Scleropages formosus]